MYGTIVLLSSEHYETAYPTESVFHKKRQILGNAGKMMFNVPTKDLENTSSL